MKILLLVLCLLPALLSASPVEKELDTLSSVNTFSRYLRVHTPRPAQCSNASDCLADSTLKAPSASLVQCSPNEDLCVCSGCFTYNSAGLCTVCPSYQYNNTSSECGVDRRPKQLAAFLLSLFLSSIGAANFYIHQNGLGVGQLVLFLIAFVVPFIMCCLPCCLVGCMDKDKLKGSLLFIILMAILVLVMSLASLALSAWWIADLVIFATNRRLSGDGCMLSPWKR